MKKFISAIALLISIGLYSQPFTFLDVAFINNNNNNYRSIGSLPIIPVMTSSNMPSGYAYASSELNIAGSIYYAWHAFDGITGTWWWNDEFSSARTNWLRYDFISTNSISSVKCTIINQSSTNASIFFMTSLDATNWISQWNTNIPGNASVGLIMTNSFSSVLARYAEWLVILPTSATLDSVGIDDAQIYQ